MDFHGAPMSRTWMKLGATASKGARQVSLADPVTGWRVGDRVIVTATHGDNGTGGTRRRTSRDPPGVTNRNDTDSRPPSSISDPRTESVGRPCPHAGQR